MTTIQVELPEQLTLQVCAFVAEGWCASESALIEEALRRFLEAWDPELAARYVKRDFDWGLQGKG